MGSIFRRSNGVYYAKLKRGDRWVKTSLGTRNKRDAAAALRILEAEQAERRRGPEQSGLSVRDLVETYRVWAAGYYVQAGRETSQVARVKAATERLLLEFGALRCDQITVLSMRQLRDRWIADGLAVRTVSGYAAVVRHLFRWAAYEGLIPRELVAAAEDRAPYRRAGQRGRVTEERRPVEWAHVEALCGWVPDAVYAVMELQWWTGARSGELLRLRAGDIDCSARVWCARLADHKLAHAGKDRVIFFGPRAQEVLGPYIQRKAITEFLFDPREAQCADETMAPMPQKPDRKRAPGAHYTTRSYGRAVRRGIERFNADLVRRNRESERIPLWTPHQLRHSAATRIRAALGLEAAQVVLGHTRADVTQIYAERDLGLAIRVAAELG